MYDSFNLAGSVAPTTGTFTGIVVTTAAAPISGATITYSGPSSGTLTSSLAGTFGSPALPPGSYTVSITYPPGFVPSGPASFNITITAGNNVFVTFTGSVAGGPTGSLLPVRGAALPGSLVTSVFQYNTCGANVHKITYRMTEVCTGLLTQATAWLAVPTAAAPPNGWPIISAGNGASGLGDSTAPDDDWAGSIGDLCQAIASGFAVVNVNMEGHGDPSGDRHPYLVRTSSAYSMIDAVRASAAVAPIRDRAAFWGFSAGGYTSLSAGELLASYAPEFSAGVVVAVDPVTYPEWMDSAGLPGNWGANYTVGQIYGMWVESCETLNTGLVLAPPYNTNPGMAGLDNSVFGEGAFLNNNPSVTGGGWSTAVANNTLGNQLSVPVRLRTATGGINLNWAAYMGRAGISGTSMNYSNDPGGHDFAFRLSQLPSGLTWAYSTLGV